MPELPESPHAPLRERQSLIVLLAAVTLAFFAVVAPFYGAVMWGVIIGLVFAPVQRLFLRRLSAKPGRAAAATIVVVLLIAILPLALLVNSLAQEGARLAAGVQSGQIDFGSYLQRMLGVLPAPLMDLLDRFGLGDSAQIQRRIVASVGRIGQFFAGQALNLGQGTLEWLASFFVALYIAYFMLRDGRTLWRSVSAAIPLREGDKAELARRFTAVVRATVRGNVVVSVVQGVLGGIAFAVLGVHGALLWGTVMAFLSLLPAVGAALVWLPVALYLMATAALWKGLGLIFFGTVVIGLVDNLLRPVLVGKDTRLPDWLVLVSTLGGMALLGINGFVVGPLAAAMFVAVWGLFGGSARSGT
jgi:predicted PurR-regulated permease PerM